MRITNLINNLRTLGDNVEEVRVVQKFLRVAPPRYTQIAVAIETLLDLHTISVEELMGRLHSADERCAITGLEATGGRLLLMEESGKQGGGSANRGEVLAAATPTTIAGANLSPSRAATTFAATTTVATMAAVQALATPAEGTASGICPR